MKRPRHPRVPEFKPLAELAPGEPFNPYALFETWSIRQALGKFRKLSAAGKFIYLMLADQVYTSDYDWHTEANLAELCGVSRRQFQRHLRTLKKLRLVHAAPDIGRQNYIWLLYHPAFALCSPRTPDKSVVGGRTELSQGVGQNRRTQRNVQRNIHTMGPATLDKATSYRGSSGPIGRRDGEEPIGGETLPPGTDNGEFVYSVSPLPGLRENTPASDAAPGEVLVVARDARSFWYSLTPLEKQNRRNQAVSCVDRIYHFRQYLRDPDPAIERQARHEITRALDELRGFGFTLHTNGKGKL